jgi:hypothetical protein
MKDARIPDEGGRVILERATVGDAVVEYRATLCTPDGEGTATVAVDRATGTVSFSAWTGGEPPAWLVAFARAFLRSEWLERRDEPDAPWPARINRWRAQKAAT